MFAKKCCPKNKKLAFFSAKLVQSVFLCHRLSKKLNFIKIWKVKVDQNKGLVCYRKKQSFRQCAWGLRQLVLNPVLGLKRGLWVCRKSQKISTASDQYFLSYVNKTTGGGQCPSRNRVKGTELIHTKGSLNSLLLLSLFCGFSIFLICVVYLSTHSFY